MVKDIAIYLLLGALGSACSLLAAREGASHGKREATHAVAVQCQASNVFVVDGKLFFCSEAKPPSPPTL